MKPTHILNGLVDAHLLLLQVYSENLNSSGEMSLGHAADYIWAQTMAMFPVIYTRRRS